MHSKHVLARRTRASPSGFGPKRRRSCTSGSMMHCSCLKGGSLGPEMISTGSCRSSLLIISCGRSMDLHQTCRHHHNLDDCAEEAKRCGKHLLMMRHDALAPLTMSSMPN